MSLPINISDLISKKTIEDSRIEYKRSWNPEKILHTICAFANDYENIGGGYIVVGIEEKDSRPDQITGVTEEEVGRIIRDLAEICNMIDPYYVPVYSEEYYHDARLFVIWSPAGESRPYKCPITLGNNRKTNEKCYYIRRLSNTIRATRDEEKELISITRVRTFDDSTNLEADVSDINMVLIQSYLDRVKSKLDLDSEDKIQVLRNMRLVHGPSEILKPLNIGLMMFNRRPDDFFPYAWIDLVIMPDPTGDGMREHSFKGSFDTQLLNVLEYIGGILVEERIYKLPDRAEAVRVFNYPFDALEEIIVNAVYHKDYRIGQQITITFKEESVEITSFPGPDACISDEDLEKLTMHSPYCRNKRLGDYLKELHLAEGRNTGIPKIVNALKNNGSEMPEYITDRDRTFLTVRVPVHERFRGTGTILNQSSNSELVSRRTSEELAEEVLGIVRERGCISTKEIWTALGYNGPNDGVRRAIKRLLDEGKIAYLYPDNPRSSKQRICPVIDGTMTLRND